MTDIFRNLMNLLSGHHAAPAPAPVAAPTAASEERPRTLWRAVCFAIEPFLMDRPVPSPSENWGFPRHMLTPMQQKIAEGMTGWSTLLQAYSRAKTPAERLQVARDAMAETGLYLARAPGFDGDPDAEEKNRSMKLFGRALMAGAHFIDIARITLNLPVEALEAMPFAPVRGRQPPFVDGAAAVGVGEAALKATRHLSGFRLAPLVLIQCTMVVRPGPAILYGAPPEHLGDPADLADTPYGPFLDFLLWDLDREAEIVAHRAARLAGALAKGHMDAAADLAARMERLKSHVSAVGHVVHAHPGNPVAVRLNDSRSAACDALAAKAAPVCAWTLVMAGRDGSWDNPEASEGLSAVASLLRSAAKVAKYTPHGPQALDAIAEVRTALRDATTNYPTSPSLWRALGMLGNPPATGYVTAVPADDAAV